MFKFRNAFDASEARYMRYCEESPPRQLLEAVRQFNAGEWFECHETLEDLWVGEKGKCATFTRESCRLR